MIAIFDLVARLSLLLAIGLSAAALLRHRSAALRHAVLATALLGLPLVPLAAALLPPIALPLLAATGGAPTDAGSPVEGATVTPISAPPSGSPPAAVAARPIAWPSVLLAVWSLGTIVALILLARSFARLATAVRRAAPVTDGRWLARLDAAMAASGTERPVRLLLLADQRWLAVWGWQHPSILVPACALDWPDGRIGVVLRHELAHVDRGDWLVHLYASVVRALLWWHPLAWLACRQLAVESEQACDDAVLAHGASRPSTYAEHLVAIARALQPERSAAFTISMASSSTLHRRIAAMLNPDLDRTAPARTTLSVLAAVAATTVLSLGLVRAVQPAQTLQGSVYDPTGAVLPGVTLVLRSGDTKAVSTTDAAGQFVFAGVPAGRHVLEARVPGFREFSQEVELQQDADWTRTVTLQVGRIQEQINVRSKRGTAASAATSGPTAIRVGGNIRPPRKLKDVRPVYPTTMRDEGREARVTIDAVIGADGRVIAAHVTSPEIHPDFAVAAVDAVKQWVFSPTLLNGSPIDVVMTVTIEFTLE